MISEGDELPNPSRIVRYVGFNKMFKDEDENIFGPAIAAFELRPDEDYLSATWCEYFAGAPDEQLRCAIEAIRNDRKVGGKACFCVANTQELKAIAAEFGATIRGVYLPVASNPAHSGVYGISSDEKQLLERLASETWAEFFTKEMADALPLSECSKAPNVV